MIATFAILLALASPAVPSQMLGTWSSGSCKDPSALLVITPTTAALGTHGASNIVYFPDDDGAGHGAIHWQEEGSVDNFVYDPGSDVIIYNAQGYHMPGAVKYSRCPAG
jgi:hypothetical protein